MNLEHTGSLLARQHSQYRGAHGDRRNLAIHAVAVPLFLVGNVTLVAGTVLGSWVALAGIAAMALAMAAQGRGHRGEAVAPAPFTGAGNAVARIFAEQWVTFPRFVLTGGYARAWRAGASAMDVGNDGVKA